MSSHLNSTPKPRRPFVGYDRERATYERHKPDLLKTAEGQWVVIVGEDLVGPLESDEEALRGLQTVRPGTTLRQAGPRPGAATDRPALRPSPMPNLTLPVERDQGPIIELLAAMSEAEAEPLKAAGLSVPRPRSWSRSCWTRGRGRR